MGDVQVFDGDGESQEMVELRALLAETKKLNVMLAVERDELKDNYDRTTQELAEKDRRIAELENETSRLRSDLDDAESKCREKGRECDRLESQVSDLERKVRDLENERRW